MTVTTNDLRAKLVRAELLDLESRAQYLSDLWTDMGDALGAGQSLDVGYLTDALAAADMLDSGGANQDVAVSTATYGNDNLVVDQARSIHREIPTFDDIFTAGGGWVEKLAPKVLTKLRNDRDTKDIKYLLSSIAFETSAVASQAYHVNAAAAGISKAHIGTAIARMMNTEGADFSKLAWFINPWMSESVKLLPTYTSNQENMSNRIGLGRIGFLNDIPVYASQSVPQSQTVACVGVTVSGGNAVFAVPAANRIHGLVVGQKVWSLQATTSSGNWRAVDGDDIPQATPIAIGAVASDQSTITVPYAGTGTTDATATITLTVDACPNMLVRLDHLMQATIRYRVGTRVVPYGRERPTDVLQSWTIWGRKAHAGSVIVVHTPQAVSSS